MARKILTIGITINLENYENLRLEVQGEVGEDGNAEPIIAYLDGMLARLGHGDEATAALVDSYRRRVLSIPGIVEPPQLTAAQTPARKGGEAPPAPREPAQPAPPRAAAAPTPAPVQRQAEPRPAVEPPQEEQAPQEEKPATVRVSTDTKPVKAAARPAAKAAEAPAPPAQAPAPKKGAAPSPGGEARKEPEPKEPAPKEPEPKLAEGEVPCEGCGAGITKNQEKLSKLLTGKSLCKRCMNP